MKITLIAYSLVVISLFSCTSYNRTLREPNSRVEFVKNDFTFSEQLSAEASSTTVIGIDFARLFKTETGTVEGSVAGFSMAQLPVVGQMFENKTGAYALHDMMKNNPGYDVIFYPQYETKVFKPVLGIGFITKITTVKATARLGKIK